jgi:hypothetical protein
MFMTIVWLVPLILVVMLGLQSLNSKWLDGSFQPVEAADWLARWLVLAGSQQQIQPIHFQPSRTG